MVKKGDKRENLLQQLNQYAQLFRSEAKLILQFKSFVEDEPACFERSCAIGHVTGSGLVVDHSLSKVLLTYHAKLRKWLQLGGHSDGHPLVHETALRECEEESGLTCLKFFSTPPRIFDLDIHEIPPYGSDGAHLHFDVRFLVVSDGNDFKPSTESVDLKWFSLADAFRATSEPSMIRSFEKLKVLQAT